ncbi:excitatory amino acid transporter-like [Convolutriloba macropyga]|uniref:excitatory amino acid transporter-like n=1 Tax=Convolutriloba macropyga TaxID=536237 RepID=UPI003F526238
MISKMKDQLLLILTLCSIILAIVTGVLLRLFEVQVSDYAMYLITFPGELMFRLLKMMIAPLIVITIISGVCSCKDGADGGKIGGLVITYYIFTSAFATCLGLSIVLVVSPYLKTLSDTFGVNEDELNQWKKFDGNAIDAIMDLLRNAVPDNLVSATMERVRTHYTKVYLNATGHVVSSGSLLNDTMIRDNSNALVMEVTRRSVETVSGTNLIGLIVFSVLFALTLLRMQDECEHIISTIHTISRVVLAMVTSFMWVTPVGIFSLIVGNILQAKELGDLATILVVFCGVVLIGLSIHLFVVLTGLYLFVVRKNPLAFYKHISKAAVTAFGTSSSSATLPITFHCLEREVRVDPVITRLMLPLGSVINMDGGALYEAMACVFIAHLSNFDLTVADYFTICLASIASSVGAPSIPAAGMVTTILVFTSVGLPVDRIALIYSVDWLLDRFRTLVNVCGDCVGCAILNALCHEKLEESRRTVKARGNSLRRTPSMKRKSASKLLDELSDAGSSIPVSNGIELNVSEANV